MLNQSGHVRMRFIKDFRISHKTQVLVGLESFFTVLVLFALENNARDENSIQFIMMVAFYLVKRGILFNKGLQL